MIIYCILVCMYHLLMYMWNFTCISWHCSIIAVQLLTFYTNSDYYLFVYLLNAKQMNSR